MRRIAVAALATLLASPAFSTQQITCDGIADNSVHVAIGLGSVPGLAIFSTYIEANGQGWAIDGMHGGTPITLVQAAEDGDRMLADFADENVERIVASVRLLVAEDSQNRITVGTLSLPGTGVFGLTCEGP